MGHLSATDFLIMVALVLGIGNSYYIAKYLIRIGVIRTRFSKIAGKPEEKADKSENIKD